MRQVEIVVRNLLWERDCSRRRLRGARQQAEGHHRFLCMYIGGRGAAAEILLAAWGSHLRNVLQSHSVVASVPMVQVASGSLETWQLAGR